MKKAWFAALLLALLLFSACEKAPEYTHEVVPQPPELTVTVTEGSVTGFMYDANWIFWNEDGQKLTMTTRPDHKGPWWAAWASNPHLVTADQAARLSFALPPDKLEVGRCSTVDGSGGTVCEMTESGELLLAEGEWAYELIAQWTDETRPYHGWAKYTVCIGKN